MSVWFIAGIIVGIVALLTYLYLRSPAPVAPPSIFTGMTDEDILEQALLMDEVAFEASDNDS